MHAENIAVGSLVAMFAAILFGDAMLTTWAPDLAFLSTNDVKGIAGFTFAIIAVYIFIKARK